jgi:hypothetical protein
VIAVAGGILLALFVILVLSGLWLTARDFFRFMMRHKLPVAIVLGGFFIWAAVSVAGSYAAFPTYAQH